MDVERPRRTPWRRWWWIAPVCAVAALATSWASLDAWFVGDDLGEIHRAQVGDQRGAHTRPVVTLLLRINRSVGDLDPLGYRLLNVALHAVVIGLVGWFATRMAARAVDDAATQRRVGVVAAVVFAALATHSEVVSWISARGDLVVAACALVAVGQWIAPDRARRRTAWAVAATAIAMLSKEQAVAIVVLCVLADWSSGPWSVSNGVTALRRAVPLVATTALIVVGRAIVLGSVIGSYGNGSQGFDWHVVRWPARWVLMAVRTVVPGMSPTSWVWFGVGTAGVLAAMAVVVGRGRPLPGPASRPLLAPALTAFGLGAVALLPGIGLGVSATDVRGDRLLHLASCFVAVGVALVAVMVVDSLDGARRTVALSVGAVVVAASFAAAIERDHRWAAAGDLNEATLSVGARWGRPRNVVVVNFADHVRGAYAQRNTLGDAAVVVHGWEAPGMVAGLAPMWAADARPTVAVTRTSGRTWRFAPRKDSCGFEDDAGTVRTVGGVRTEVLDDGSLDVRVAPDVDLRDVWFVTGGEMKDLAIEP